MKEVYLAPLSRLKAAMEATPNTPYSAYAKVATLVALNMRYEKVAFTRDLPDHPYALTAKIVADAGVMFDQIMDAAFVEEKDVTLEKKKSRMVVEKHQALWQEIWSRHDAAELQDLIDFRGHRLDVNNLRSHFEGRDCVDFGCGNGSFSFALLERGAKSIIGLDFGAKQVERAKAAATARGVADRATFFVGDVLNSGLPSDRFEFGLSNAVFHHLADKQHMERALRELARTLKIGSGFWFYTDGSGAISHDLWDMAVETLADVDIVLIEDILKTMNLTRRKMTHIADAFSATYLHSTWDEITAMLGRCGFGEFRRMISADDTSWDPDRIESDPYGREKFGDGELRVFCRLLERRT